MSENALILGSGGALLFDMDGTLVDSTLVVEQLWMDWTSRHGLDFGTVIALAHGKRDVDVVGQVAPWLDASAEAAWILEQELIRKDGLAAVPGAVAFIDTLDRRNWAIVTSASRELAETRLLAVGLPIPEIMVTAEDVSEGKPDPEGYLIAAERLGADIAASIVFEDAPSGLAAGLKSGATTVCIKATRSSRAVVWPLAVENFRDVRLRRCIGPGGGFQLDLGH